MSYYTVSNPFYRPAMANISAISNANPCVITTTALTDYVVGQTVRVVIPFDFGMYQLNNQVITITAIDSTSLTTDIDATRFQPFVTPSSVTQVPQVVPVGEVASTLSGSTVNTRAFIA